MSTDGDCAGIDVGSGVEVVAFAGVAEVGCGIVRWTTMWNGSCSGSPLLHRNWPDWVVSSC